MNRVPGRRLQLQLADLLERFFAAVLVVGQRVVGQQAALVRQQVEDRDRVLVVGGELRNESTPRAAPA